MLCFRLFSENNPAVPLADAVAQLREGQAPKDLYAVEPSSFQQIPNAPFAYWVSDRIRRLFVELPAIQAGGRKACFGLSTKDDSRFVRLFWEVGHGGVNKIWYPFSKGGSYSRYYSDLHLLLDWEEDGKRLKAFADYRTAQLFGVASWSRWINNWDYYFEPGITWPRRTAGLSFRAMPAGAIFGDKGPAVFSGHSNNEELNFLSAIMNSSIFNVLMAAQLARVELAQSFEVGIVQNTPLPKSAFGKASFSSKAAWSAKRRTDTATLTSHAFNVPALAPSRSTSKHSRP